MLFDVVRHLLEFFFFLITGPLVTIFAIKKIKQSKDAGYQTLDLAKKIIKLKQENPLLFKEHIVPLVKEFDSIEDTKKLNDLKTPPSTI